MGGLVALPEAKRLITRWAVPNRVTGAGCHIPGKLISGEARIFLHPWVWIWSGLSIRTRYMLASQARSSTPGDVPRLFRGLARLFRLHHLVDCNAAQRHRLVMGSEDQLAFRIVGDHLLR